MAKAGAKKTSKNKKTSKASRKRSRIPSRKKKPAKKISKKILKKKPTKKKVSKAPTRKKKLTPKKVAKKKSSLPKLQKASLSKSVAVESKKTLSKPELKEGDMAPLFELRDQSGRLHALSEYRGKNIVLYFYPKDDTPGCTKEACQFRDDLHHYNQLNTLIFGVSFDDEASHQKFIEKFQLNFPLLADIEKKAAEAYGVYVEKSMYGRTYMGIERSTFIIDKEGRLAKIFRGVSVDGHSAELLNELKKLS